LKKRTIGLTEDEQRELDNSFVIVPAAGGVRYVERAVPMNKEAFDNYALELEKALSNENETAT
jgi:hypothetical protein